MKYLLVDIVYHTIHPKGNIIPLLNIIQKKKELTNSFLGWIGIYMVCDLRIERKM